MNSSTRLNKLVASTCKAILTETEFRFELVNKLLTKWWQLLPTNAPAIYVDDDRLDLTALAFYVVCFMSRTNVVHDGNILVNQWTRQPVLELSDEEQSDAQARFYAYLMTCQEYRSELMKWAQSRRWYDRILRFKQIEPSIDSNDGMIEQLRQQLLSSFRTLAHGDPFFARGRDWLWGSYLPLGSHDDYVRGRPFETEHTPTLILFNKYVPQEQVEHINTEVNKDPVLQWNLMTPVIQDLWLLNHYCFVYDSQTRGSNQFHERYLIHWHQWDQHHSDLLIETSERMNRPALPFICAIGANVWAVRDKDITKCQICRGGPIHALLVWLQRVQQEFNGQSESGQVLPNFGINAQ